MIEKSKYPKLKNLIGGYFHQDWEHSYDWKNQEPHYAPVVRFFKFHNPTSTTKQVISELKHFLALGLDEKTLDKVLEDVFILGVHIPYWKITHEKWLKDILNILEEPMEKTKKEFIPEFIG